MRLSRGEIILASEVDGSKKVLVGMHDAQNEVMVSGGSMPPGASSDYTFSIWVFVANWKQNAVTTDKVKNFSLQPSFFLILKDVSK